MLRPSFARSLISKSTALQGDLEDYLRYFNFERAHAGIHNASATPAQLVYGAQRCAHHEAATAASTWTPYTLGPAGPKQAAA
jgi:hypothetical protein